MGQPWVTSPFSANRLGFTADGSLWAFGRERLADEKREKPLHDVLWQYDAEGNIVRSLVPRLSLSSGKQHPVTDGFMYTSRNYVALVSNTARTWTIVSSKGLVVESGSLDMPESYAFPSGAITDSGRLFIQGYWRGDRVDDPAFQSTDLFEIDRESGSFRKVDSQVLAQRVPARPLLVGSDGENLVFRVQTSEIDVHLAWTPVK